MNTTRSFRLVVNKTAQTTAISGVYLITDQGDNLVERVRAALCGGVRAVQYRAKEREWDERRAEGEHVKRLCAGLSLIHI